MQENYLLISVLLIIYKEKNKILKYLINVWYLVNISCCTLLALFYLIV